jgi:putative phosphoesterase
MSKHVVKIGVIADTHVKSIFDLPALLLRNLKNLDMVIHLGDCETVEFIKDIDCICDFAGVAGNHDRNEMKTLLPEKMIIEINGKRLGLVHGHGCFLPFGLHTGLKNRFSKDNVDAILFGHTHIIKQYRDGDTLFFNPGTTAGRFPALRPSYGIITVNDAIHSEICYLDNPSYHPLYEYRSLQKYDRIEASVAMARRYSSAISRFFITGNMIINDKAIPKTEISYTV